MNGIEYDKFLGKLYDILLNEDVIQYDVKAKDLKTKKIRVQNYLDKLERVQTKAQNGKQYINIIKELYYDRYVIKEENIPQDYFEFLEKKYLEEGSGHINLINPQHEYEKRLRQEHIDTIIREQKDSLDNWLNYFLSDESKYLPMWAKVWAFQGMLHIGNLNKNKDGYSSRGKKTVNPFVSMDSEILGKCVELLKEMLNKEKIEDSEIEKIVSSGSFAKLYGKLLANKRKINITTNEGIWIKYNRETLEQVEEKEKNKVVPEYLKLYNSLQGYNTGWCTAGSRETAKNQICGGNNYGGGDFYVFYTLDENNEYKIPRLAIRMENGGIREICGIAEGQNIEPNMELVIEEKLKEFPDGESYQYKVDNLKELTIIYNKHKNNEELTIQELRDLYGIDKQLVGFLEIRGLSVTDPRVEEIISERNKKKDLSKIFNCIEEEIGFVKEDLKRKLVFYRNTIELNVPYVVKTMINEFEIPVIINELIFPENVHGNIFMSEVVGAKKIVMPKSAFHVRMDKLKVVKDFSFPVDSSIYGIISLGIRKLENVVFPKSAIELSLGVKTAINVVFSEHVGGNVNLGSLVNANNVIFPKYVGKMLWIPNLKSLSGITLPEFVGGDVYYKGRYYTLIELKEMQKQEELGVSIISNSLGRGKNMGFVNIFSIIVATLIIGLLSILVVGFILNR